MKIDFIEWLFVRLASASRLVPELDERIATGVAFTATTFISIIDTTIVNVALPSISRDFHVAVASVGTVSVGYLVSLAVAIPVGGWLGDRWGTKRMFCASLALFTVASVLCGVASNLPQLVAFRVVQGIGGGLLAPLGTTMLFRAYTPAERVRAARVLVLPTSVAPALGPLLGGILVDRLSWRWVFFVNLPVGVAVLVFAALFLRERVEPDEGGFDLAGFVLAGAGLGLLMYALSDGSVRGWRSPEIGAALAVGLLLTVGFVVVELRSRAPMLRLRLLGERVFASANVVVLLSVAAFAGLLYATPLFLQEGLGLSAFQSGLTTFPEAIGLLVGSQLISRLYPRLGPRPIMLVGALGLTGTAAALALDGSGEHLWVVRALMLCTGFSMISVQLPNQTLAFTPIAGGDTGHASSLYNANRRFGGALGVAALSSVIGAAAGSAGGSLVGYRFAFAVAGAFAAAAVVAAVCYRMPGEQAAPELLASAAESA